MQQSPSKPCCAPSSEERRDATLRHALYASTCRFNDDAPMISLPAATFLMGTDSPESFVQDGEGPVRPVTLSAFAIDRDPVTNDRFAHFVQETGYKTEAER